MNYISSRLMAYYRESGFGSYVLLTLFSGFIVLLVAFFLAALTLGMLGYIELNADWFTSPLDLLKENTWMLLLLWLIYWLTGMAVAYHLLWRGRSFR